jgi:integrase
MTELLRKTLTAGDTRYTGLRRGELLALRWDCIDFKRQKAGGMSVTAFAEKLGMTRTAISRIIHGKAAI